MAECMVKFGDILEKVVAPKEQGVRHAMKVPTMIEFPKGNEDQLEDVDAYLREVERVCKHMVAGGKLDPMEKASMLVLAWPKSHRVGQALRLTQEKWIIWLLNAMEKAISVGTFLLKPSNPRRNHRQCREDRHRKSTRA